MTSGEDVAAAIDVGQRLLRHDPLRESAHRSMMRLYHRLGDRTAALRQYEACRDALAQQLGVKPAEETRALARTIRRES